ncbi:Amidase signature domain containing protein [Hyaloscypha variabilis]
MFGAIRLVLSYICAPWSPTRTIELLTATASDLEAQLKAGSITSRQLVTQYFSRIGKYDDYLQSILVKNPDALRQADVLDEERRGGRVRGPLHGIPILLKDNIATHPELGMDTTGGSFALVGSRPRKNAEIVDRLISAGMIILGKANLSELSGFKGSGIMPGWSAVGGQTQSAYTVGNVDLTDNGLGHSSPGGSSTGAAVAVSAGLAPIAIGTDTGGSLITPCTRAALYTIRPTMGLVSQQGIIPISYLFDTPGPIAKSPLDLANLLDVLVDPSTNDKGSYAKVLPGKFSEIKIGVLSPKDWFFGPGLQRPAPSAQEQIIRETEKAYAKLKRLAKSFKEVTLISVEELQVNEAHSFYDIQTARFERTLKAYLEDLETSSTRTLDQLIQFNKDHADQEMPPDYDNQEQLIAAANTTMSDIEHDRLLNHARSISRERGIDLTLKEYGVDVIIAPADSAFNLLVSSAGYTSATMPLSTLDYNGRPFGLAAFTTANGEKLLLQTLSAWEGAFPRRRVPPNLGA